MRTPGSDAPSTLGGDGWAAREASHIDEVKAGALWRRAGYRSEVSPLRAVALAWPPGSLAKISDPASGLMLERVDLAAMRAQADVIASTFRRDGIEVLMADHPATAPPNIVFMRDLFFMTPAGAVIARMASVQRAGEERYAAAALADAGYPILRTVTGAATFEGADALWLDDRTVAVGVGFRTNPAGLREVSAALHDQGAQAVAVPLNAGVQHLLGSVVMLDERLAAVHAGASPRLRELLRERDYRVIAFEPDAEFVGARGMNLVTIAPRRVVMPAGAPTIRKRLEGAGVEVQAVDVGEYLKAAGGLGCVTGILHRDW
jgi:N-dimethylarginine dimethylaminohydrolase